VTKNHISPDLYSEVAKLGAKDMEACLQCGNCASACPLSAGENTFPRKIYRYLQLGLKDKLLESRNRGSATIAVTVIRTVPGAQNLPRP